MADFSIDTSRMTASGSIKGESTEETNLLKEMAEQTREFVSSQKWCGHVDSLYLAYGIGGVVGIFLVELTPSQRDADPWLWVIVGDLPPAYLVTEGNPTAADALDGYLYEMTRWVKAVEQGQSVEDLIPVNVPPTVDSANQLRGRLEFLRSKVLPLLGTDQNEGTP